MHYFVEFGRPLFSLWRLPHARRIPGVGRRGVICAWMLFLCQVHPSTCRIVALNVSSATTLIAPFYRRSRLLDSLSSSSSPWLAIRTTQFTSTEAYWKGNESNPDSKIPKVYFQSGILACEGSGTDRYFETTLLTKTKTFFLRVLCNCTVYAGVLSLGAFVGSYCT